MPNWCQNTLKIEGDIATLACFKEKAKHTHDYEDKKVEVDFALASFLPMPKELVGTTSPCAPNPRLLKKYGASNWYDWNCKHYGTKWDVEGALICLGKGKLGYTFDSAWAPPAEGILRISKKYPQLTFTLEYDEPGMDFSGVVVVKGGKVLRDQSGKSLINQEDM